MPNDDGRVPCAPVETCATIGGSVACKRVACGVATWVCGRVATTWRRQDLSEMASCGNSGALLTRFGGNVVSLRSLKGLERNKKEKKKTYLY